MARTIRQKYEAAVARINKIDERVNQLMAKMKEKRDDVMRKLIAAQNDLNEEISRKKQELEDIQKVTIEKTTQCLEPASLNTTHDD
ncbi:MAG: hypothetical protein ABIK92_21900 [Pseudomonadota bacterium]